MKTKIYLPIQPFAKIMVSSGDQINNKTVIQQIPAQFQQKEIPVGKILNIHPSTIPKYFKKKIGEEIMVGEIIAQKKGLLSTRLVKSPLSGRITQIDLKKGTLTISGQTNETKKTFTCPVSGKVKDINKNQIEIEAEVQMHRGLKGDGEDVIGILRFANCNSLGVLDISFEVENGIIVCKSISEDVVAKLDVLGAHGLIGNKLPQKINLAWVQVEESVLEELSTHDNQNVWLRPIHKEIIVYN